ncbi:MAG: hypothetical protein R3E02_05885 [Blastomonas sp.]
MKAVAALIVAIVALSPAAARAETIDFGWLAEKFQLHCAAVFLDEESFHIDLAPEETGFETIEEPRHPGELWSNGDIQLSYISAGQAPAGVPAPQCRMTADVAGSFDHLASVGALNRQLSISGGSTSGKAMRNRTIWSYANEAGTPLKLFFDSRPQGAGFWVSLTIMNVKD